MRKPMTALVALACALSLPVNVNANGGGWGDAGAGAGGAFDHMESYEAESSHLGPKPMTAAELQNEYNAAVSLLAGGDYKRASRKFEMIAKHVPKNADVWNYAAYSLRKSGDVKKGEAAYKRALRLEPNHPRANQYYGELLVELNRIPEAEERLAVLNACCAAAQMTKDLAAMIADAKGGKPITFGNKAAGY